MDDSRSTTSRWESAPGNHSKPGAGRLRTPSGWNRPDNSARINCGGRSWRPPARSFYRIGLVNKQCDGFVRVPTETIEAAEHGMRSQVHLPQPKSELRFDPVRNQQT